jgi:hypothetical protein
MQYKHGVIFIAAATTANYILQIRSKIILYAIIIQCVIYYIIIKIRENTEIYIIYLLYIIYDIIIFYHL